MHKESETPSTSGEGERKFTESSLVYSIPDSVGRKFLSDFFAAAGDCVLPAVFRGLNFCKKISRAKHAQPKDVQWKNLFFHK